MGDFSDLNCCGGTTEHSGRDHAPSCHRTLFKARVLNQKVNILGNAEVFSEGSKVNVIIRPESLELVNESDIDATRGIVALKSFLGPMTKVGIAVEGAPLIHLNIASRAVRKLEIGDRIAFKISSDEVMAERV